MAAESSKSLTGVWTGMYTYPNSGEPIFFTASLIESGSLVTGTTHETCATIDSPRTTLHAMLSGSRGEGYVVFTKEYDGSGGWSHTVEYDGMINGEATEIEGHWNINGLLAGRFMMMRNPGKQVAVKREVLEKV